MSKRLMILEVSQKQSYIFASKRLKDNADRSLQIREVTESSFFQETAGLFYSEAENLGGTFAQPHDSQQQMFGLNRLARQAFSLIVREIEYFIQTLCQLHILLCCL